LKVFISIRDALAYKACSIRYQASRDTITSNLRYFLKFEIVWRLCHSARLDRCGF
jgi:hypothetical protein